MLFHSQEFVLFFLPIIVVLYYMLAEHIRSREILLVALHSDYDSLGRSFG